MHLQLRLDLVFVNFHLGCFDQKNSFPRDNHVKNRLLELQSIFCDDHIVIIIYKGNGMLNDILDIFLYYIFAVSSRENENNLTRSSVFRYWKGEVC